MIMSGAAIDAGAVAEVVASRKEAKYANLGSRYIFDPIAVETLGIFTARCSYASAVLGVVILSVRPSVTRVLCD